MQRATELGVRVGFLIGAICLTLTSRSALEVIAKGRALTLDDKTQMHEVLYLPNGKALGLISFGYRNVLADLLWFETINYFGKHYHTDKNFRWLAHMCDLVTSLDPQAMHVYLFGGTMLAWEGGVPEESDKLLTKGVKNFPVDWYLYYLRGFNSMYFLNDPERAKADFITASRLPEAPVFLARLAAKKLIELRAAEEAVSFLEEMIRNTPDDESRRVLLLRLEEARRAH